MSDYAARARSEQARQVLPLRRLMEQRGRGPANGNWKTFPKCPYCQKDSATVFEDDRGRGRFKCFHTSCPSGTAGKGGAWDEVGFLAYELGLSRKEAFIAWLKEAGVWKEGMNAAPKPEPPPEADDGSDPGDERVRFDDLPATEPAAPDHAAGPSKPESLCDSESRPDDGVAAVPTAPIPFDDGVNASPVREPIPTQPAGEASPLPPKDSVVTPGESDVAAKGTDSAPPDDFEKSKVQGLKSKVEDGEADVQTPAPERGPPKEPPKVLLAIRYFYERSILTEEDARQLWEKRGLTLETCTTLGYRSSLRSNEKILREMGEKFPVNVLLDSCLWVPGDGPGDEVRPNPQYYGWGVVGKGQNDEWEWGWTHPVLIPYLNGQGELIDLRPHKRTQRGQNPRLYIPRPLREHQPKFEGKINPQFAVFTEGEFKAGALFQTLWDQAAIVALPGITMSKPLWGDIEDFVKELGLRRQTVVVFDNEDKATPGKPGYKEERWKRFDSEVWARYLARRIAREGFTAKVGHLPNDWRDEKGKADWDGALALLIARSGVRAPNQAEAWEKCKGRIRMLFLGVMSEAVKPEEVRHLGLFSWQDEEQIERNLKRAEYVQQLPHGTSEEKRIATRLWRLVDRLKGDNERLPASGRWLLGKLAAAYSALEGQYYILKELQEKTEATWQDYKARASANDDVELKRACEIALEGIPEPITDFIVEPLYCLLKVDGTRERVLRILNMHGKVTPLLYLPSVSFASPKPFREWLLDASNSATFKAGERQLQALQADIGQAVALKEVVDVPLRGLDSRTGIYFFGDVAITPEGKHLFPDKQGLYWHQGTGYRLADRDQEGEEFRLGTPLMHPKSKPPRKRSVPCFKK